MALVVLHACFKLVPCILVSCFGDKVYSIGTSIPMCFLHKAFQQDINLEQTGNEHGSEQYLCCPLETATETACSLCCSLVFVLFLKQTGFHYVAQSGFELKTLLSPLPKHTVTDLYHFTVFMRHRVLYSFFNCGATLNNPYSSQSLRC